MEPSRSCSDKFDRYLSGSQRSEYNERVRSACKTSKDDREISNSGRFDSDSTRNKQLRCSRGMLILKRCL